MSTESYNSVTEPTQTKVLEVSEFTLDEITGYASEIGDVYFERRCGRTFLISNN